MTDVQEMAQDMNPTLAKEGNFPEEDPDAPGGKTYDSYEIVSKLMRDQGLQGDPKEFIPGYYKELNTVTTLRLKPVSPEVAAYIRSKKLAVRLKMLLEVQKDNRRKGRLVLQGCRAPAWWKVGPTDSPVVATSALRYTWRTGSDIST